MTQVYSDPRRESDVDALPDLEVWEVSKARARANELRHREHADRECPTTECIENEAGWYWQACVPGCLPDGDPVGPFATEAEALADARDGLDDDNEETP